MTARAVERVVHLRELRRFDDAEREARLALAAEPEDPGLLVELAAVLLAAQRGSEGLPVADAAVRAAPSSERAHRIRAVLLAQLGRHDEALQAGWVAVGLAPEEPWAALAYAVVLQAAGRLDVALAVARRAVALAPHEPATHLRLGAIASERGEKALARRAFEEALRLDPHSAVARHDLALLERDPGRALRGLVEAGGIDPSMPGVLPNVAAVLWRLSYRMRMLLLASTVLFVGLSGSGAATSPDSARLAALVVLAVVALVTWSTCRGLPVRTLPVVRAALRGNGWLTATFITIGCCVVVYVAVVISGVAVVAVVAWLLLGALGCQSLIARMSHRSSRRRAQRRAQEHR